MDSYKADSSASFSSTRSLIMELRVSLFFRMATRVARRMTLSVASFSLAVRSLKALVSFESPKGNTWWSTGFGEGSSLGKISGMV